jgi:hypothetical protein
MSSDQSALNELKALLAAKPEPEPAAAQRTEADEETGQSFEETKRRILEIELRALEKMRGVRSTRR